MLNEKKKKKEKKIKKMKRFRVVLSAIESEMNVMVLMVPQFKCVYLFVVRKKIATNNNCNRINICP